MFKKKDGTIKERYVNACIYIINARKYTEEISIGRNDNIVERNECYQIQKREGLSKRRTSFISKVEEICSYYGFKINTWYGACGDFSINIIGEDISNMTGELKELIGGELK